MAPVRHHLWFVFTLKSVWTVHQIFACSDNILLLTSPGRKSSVTMVAVWALNSPAILRGNSNAWLVLCRLQSELFEWLSMSKAENKSFQDGTWRKDFKLLEMLAHDQSKSVLSCFIFLKFQIQMQMFYASDVVSGVNIRSQLPWPGPAGDCQSGPVWSWRTSCGIQICLFSPLKSKQK